MVRAMGIDMEQKLKRNGDGKASEYGLFIQNHLLFTTAGALGNETEIDLQTELAAWEAASDEDWLGFEQQFAQNRQSSKKPTLMHKLSAIQIDGPADLATNLNLYTLPIG